MFCVIIACVTDKKHDPKTAQAIEDIRDLVTLASADIELKMGGPLTHEAMLSIRNWIARAYEAGIKQARYGTVR